METTEVLRAGDVLLAGLASLRCCLLDKDGWRDRMEQVCFAHRSETRPVL